MVLPEKQPAKMSTFLQVSLRDIFRYRLRKTYEEMREKELIDDKLNNGSPRTVE